MQRSKKTVLSISHILLDECGIYQGAPEEDFNTEKLTGLIKEELNIQINGDMFQDVDVDTINERITTMMEELYEKKMAQLDPQQRNEIERILYLQVLDPQWREHLYEMDVLKTGIGLRGYNQKDPLTEYKQDSYRLFTELVQRIKYEAVKTLQLVQFSFRSPEDEEAAVEHIREELDSSIADAVTNEENTEQKPKKNKPVAAAAKPKRNDTCPCGSGQKYKNCCGQSGPKKGLLA